MPAVSAAAVDHALARAVVYRTLSLGFQAPSKERLRLMGAFDSFSALGAAWQTLDRPERRQQQALPVAALTSATSDADALSAGYWRLFGHTTRGLVCACETEYGPDNGFHQPQQLADISGYYLAFGLRALASSEVRPDHVACECEFMDFLCRKEALLLANQRRVSEETLEVTRQAARTFLREHLGHFGRAFAGRVAAEDDGFFGVLGGIFLRFLDRECARAGVEAGPADLAVRPDLVDEAPMACGTAEELIQIQRRP